MKKILALIVPIAFFHISCGNNSSTENTAEKKDSVQVSSTGPLISFEDSNGTGFKDMKGDIVIPAIFEHSFTDTFDHKIAFVLDKSQGFIAIDRSGKKVLTPFVYDNGPDYINEGLFRFVENKKMGFSDEDGKIIIPAKYEFVSYFEGGLACFGNGFTLKKDGDYELMEGGKWGMINLKGDTISQQMYNTMPIFVDSLWQVKEKGKKNGTVFLKATEGIK